MIQKILVREAQKVPNRDVGDLDSTCFQILDGEEVITVRTSNISETRQWINSIDGAIKNQKQVLKKTKLGTQSELMSAIGTLEVVLLNAIPKPTFRQSNLILIRNQKLYICCCNC
jgi:flagellar motor switch protein FliG